MILLKNLNLNIKIKIKNEEEIWPKKIDDFVFIYYD